MSRRNIVPKILEILQQQAEVTADLLDIFFSGYNQSYKKMRRSLKYGPRQFDTDWAFEYQKRQQFYTILNKLKNEGFIEKKSTDSKSSIWKITKRGLEKLKLIKEKELFSSKSADYEKKEDDKIKIIIFDIPEKERRKRTWLRAALNSMEFNLLQQSVWAGKSKIPEQFLRDLRERKMLDYVQIFEISKKGTISQIS